jgi:hypothetical protein
MGIASVILGILGILLSWIPCLWPIVAVHVVIGLALGIGGVVAKQRTARSKIPGDEEIRQGRISVDVAGICLNVIAVILTIVWTVFWETQGFGAFE